MDHDQVNLDYNSKSRMPKVDLVLQSKHGVLLSTSRITMVLVIIMVRKITTWGDCKDNLAIVKAKNLFKKFVSCVFMIE